MLQILKHEHLSFGSNLPLVCLSPWSWPLTSVQTLPSDAVLSHCLSSGLWWTERRAFSGLLTSVPTQSLWPVTVSPNSFFWQPKSLCISSFLLSFVLPSPPPAVGHKSEILSIKAMFPRWCQAEFLRLHLAKTCALPPHDAFFPFSSSSSCSSSSSSWDWHSAKYYKTGAKRKVRTLLRTQFNFFYDALCRNSLNDA